jgi:hypothetical protein
MNETNDSKRARPEKGMTSSRRAQRLSKSALSPEIQNKIGHQLRAMYSDVVSQGVPDRFAELINKLDQQGKNKEPK